MTEKQGSIVIALLSLILFTLTFVGHLIVEKMK